MGRFFYLVFIFFSILLKHWIDEKGILLQFQVQESNRKEFYCSSKFKNPTERNFTAVSTQWFEFHFLFSRNKKEIGRERKGAGGQRNERAKGKVNRCITKHISFCNSPH